MAKKPLSIIFLSLFHFLAFSAESSDSRLEFIENRGQWQENVLFKARSSMGYLFLEKDRITFNIYDTEDVHQALHSGSDRSLNTVDAHAFQMIFLNSSGEVEISKDLVTKTHYNFFIGNDRSKWANSRGFMSVQYRSIYPGIDLRIYSSGLNLKYEFLVYQGADHRDIKILFKGVDGLQLQQGDLIVNTSVLDIRDTKPVSWLEGTKQEILCQYNLENNIITFDIPAYNRDQTLIIDPELIFSTYSGSFADNFGYTATFDRYGYLYSGSTAFGNGYPVTTGAYQLGFAGGSGTSGMLGTDIAISKYDTSGKFMVYSTYLGGISDEVPHSIVTNDKNELYILGTTSSFDYPTTTNAYDMIFAGGSSIALPGIGVNYIAGSDIVISRLNEKGTVLMSSTFIGGNANDGINTVNKLGFNYADELRGEIEVDEQSNVYVASCTQSTDFPVTTNNFQNSFGGGVQDACFFKMDKDLTTLIFSAFLGAEEDEAAYSLALDDNYDIYISGGTNSFLFPVTSVSWQQSFGGGRADGFISKISNDGLQLLNSTYYGSPAYDQLYFIDLDDHDNIFVFGQTKDTNSAFIENAIYNQPNSGQLITKFNQPLDSIIWSTVFGSGKGSPDISPTAFLVDVCNKVYVSGWGSAIDANPLSTNNLDVSPDAFQLTTDGNDFYLMVLEDDASSMFYATYFGGPFSQEHVDGGTSRFDRKGFIYQSVCAGCNGFSDFPIKPVDAVSPSNNSFNCNNGVFKLDLGLPVVIADFDIPDTACAPIDINFINLSRTEGPGEYFWDFGDGNTSTDPSPVHTYTDPGVYRVNLLISDSLSCNAMDSTSRVITIIPNKSTDLASVVLCVDDSVEIGFTPGSDTSGNYTWIPSTGLSQNDIPNPYVKISNDESYTLHFSTELCTDTFFQDVRVRNNQLNISGDPLVCAGNTFNLQANAADPQMILSYNWSPDLAIITGDGSASVLCILFDSSRISLIATDSFGCEYFDSTFIYVSDNYPDVTATATPDTVKIGEQVQLNATSSQNVIYQWSPVNLINDPGIASPVASPFQTTWFTVAATNMEGCSALDSVLVVFKQTICGDPFIYVPNAFSPNNDGRNDELLVRGRNITSLYFAIFDRWGERVFETQDQFQPWNGTYKGSKLDPSVFAYYLEVVCDNGEKYKHKGNVTLMR